MNRFSFWHKLAFIVNCCWLITWVMRYYAFLPDGHVRSTVLVAGLILSYGVNLVANAWTAILFLRGRLRAEPTPRWLPLVNFLFLIPEIYLFLIPAVSQ